MKNQHVFRLALYGVPSSGKTCILSALSLPRVPHPDGLTCFWIENVPGHELPEGKSDKWNTEDPYHRGWKWLNEQRDQLRMGKLPLANKNEDDVMRFRFAFGAPNRGTRYVELLDYSGELITASASELAKNLRDHMRTLDGLLVLAEVPRAKPGDTPHVEDLEKLKGAFLLLTNERAAGPQVDWPIALLFNKWDRRPEYAQNENASLSELVNAFLNQTPPPPHASLVDTLRNAVGAENIRCFPVSAFGAHRILNDGAEVPVFNGLELKSFRLEDGFVWVMDRCDELEVMRFEHAAACASWYKSWQIPLGKPDAREDGYSSAVARWFFGVSPWAGICNGWKLLRRLSEKSDLHHQTGLALRTIRLKLLSQIAVFVVFLFLLISGARTTVDSVRFRSVLATKANPSATAVQLQTAESWLEGYFKSPDPFRWLSRAIVLDRKAASSLLTDLRTVRDENLWKAVTDATDPQTKVILAREYLKAFPTQGLHWHEAQHLDAEATRQEWHDRNKNYLDELALKIDTVRVDANTDLAEIHSLSEAIAGLPHPEALTDEMKEQQQVLRGRIARKQQQIEEALRQMAWIEFRQRYLSLMHNKNIKDAAAALVTRTPKDPPLKDLIADFSERAPRIFVEEFNEAMKFCSWGRARDVVNLCEDPNVKILLPAATTKELRGLVRTIDEAEDQHLYSQIVKNRPQCADQVSAYLSSAPLKTMEREVQRYQQWLNTQIDVLNLTLHLKEIRWHEKYSNYYDNNVLIKLQGQPFVQAQQISSISNASSRDICACKFSARLDETITIEVSIEAMYDGFLWFNSKIRTENSWTGTPRELMRGKTIDLHGNGFTNKVSLVATGVPPEPELPQWTTR